MLNYEGRATNLWLSQLGGQTGRRANCENASGHDVAASFNGTRDALCAAIPKSVIYQVGVRLRRRTGNHFDMPKTLTKLSSLVAKPQGYRRMGHLQSFWDQK